MFVMVKAMSYSISTHTSMAGTKSTIIGELNGQLKKDRDVYVWFKQKSSKKDNLRGGDSQHKTHESCILEQQRFQQDFEANKA